MDIENLTDDELDRLASKLAGRLPTGRHGDKIVTTRRQLLAATLGGSTGVAALVKLGIDPATAQSAAGQVGTESSPEDVFAFDLDVQNGATFNGADLSGVGSLSTDNLSINEILQTSRSSETISSGSITYQTSWIRVSAEGGSSDTLETINGSEEGDILILESSGDSITVSDRADNIFLDSDRVLNSPDDKLFLISVNGTNWNEIAFSSN